MRALLSPLGAFGVAMIAVGGVMLSAINGDLPKLARTIELTFASPPEPRVPAQPKNTGRFRVFAPEDYDGVLPGAEPVQLAPAPSLDLYVNRIAALRARCSKEARQDGIPGVLHVMAIAETTDRRGGVFAECWSGKYGEDGFIGEDKQVFSLWVCLDNPDARCDIMFEGDK